MYNKYEFFNFTYHSNARLKHTSLGSCKIKFSRKILISLAYQTQCLLISALFLESSYAYPPNSFIEADHVVVINDDEIASPAMTRSLEKIADSSQITKSISTNAQGADSKTYRIKPANAIPKVDKHNQINELNMSTMKWESELKSLELTKSGTRNSILNTKFR